MTTTPPTSTRPPEHAERYNALRTVSKIIRILAYVVAGVGALVILGVTVTTLTQGSGLGPALLVLVGGTIYVAVIALFLFAYAEIISLVIAVEDNTRLTAEALAGRGGTLP